MNKRQMKKVVGQIMENTKQILGLHSSFTPDFVDDLKHGTIVCFDFESSFGLAKRMVFKKTGQVISLELWTEEKDEDEDVLIQKWKEIIKQKYPKISILIRYHPDFEALAKNLTLKIGQ